MPRIVLVFFLAIGGFGCTRQTILLPAADAELHGLMLATTRPGYTGSAYATAFDDRSDKLVFHFNSPGGFYDAFIRYSSPTDRKGMVMRVNGVARAGLLLKSPDEFVDHPAGKIQLKRGENTIAIERGWGYFDIDSLRLAPCNRPAPPRPVPAALVDRNATPATRALMRRLAREYGHRTLSGVYSFEDEEFVERTAGVSPAIIGGDLMDYSPSRVERGAKPEGTVEALIDRAKSGAIITLSWHWNAPSGLIDRMLVDDRGREVDARWYKGFYKNATTFDIEAALADPASDDYRLIIRDIDAMAVQLRKFADDNIPVLWRPLHEAETHAFWWSARGPAAFRALWVLLYDRLTNYHGLHNLIWVWTGGNDLQWCPDEKYFDIVGVDAYPDDDRDPLGSTYAALAKRFAGKKLLALTESGHIPDIAAAQRLGVYWAYFVPWSDRVKRCRLSGDEIRSRWTQTVVVNRTKK